MITLHTKPLERLAVDVRELVLEVARDPRSTLLRKPQRVAARDLLPRSDWLRPEAGELQLAEQALLGIHRHEFGSLLHELVSSYSLFEGPAKRLLHTSHGSLGDTRPREPEAVLDSLRDAPGTEAVEPERSVRQALSAGVHDLGALIDVAALAQRVLPGPYATLGLAPVLVEAGEQTRAAHMLTALDARECRPLQRHARTVNLAMAHAACGRYREAAEGYGQACESDAHPRLLLSAVLCGLLAGDADRAKAHWSAIETTSTDEDLSAWTPEAVTALSRWTDDPELPRHVAREAVHLGNSAGDTLRGWIEG